MSLDAVIFLSLPPVTVAKYCFATLHSVSTITEFVKTSKGWIAFASENVSLFGSRVTSALASLGLCSLKRAHSFRSKCDPMRCNLRNPTLFIALIPVVSQTMQSVGRVLANRCRFAGTSGVSGTVLNRTYTVFVRAKVFNALNRSTSRQYCLRVDRSKSGVECIYLRSYRTSIVDTLVL